MSSKLGKGKLYRSELHLQLVTIHAGSFPSVITMRVQFDYGWLQVFDVFNNKWKEIKAELFLHLVALLEETEHR